MFFVDNSFKVSLILFFGLWANVSSLAVYHRVTISRDDLDVIHYKYLNISIQVTLLYWVLRAIKRTEASIIKLKDEVGMAESKSARTRLIRDNCICYTNLCLLFEGCKNNQY